MSIPANDAISLNARTHHSGRPHGPSMSSRRSLTRSPSPQFIFSAPSKTSDTFVNSKRKPLRRPSQGTEVKGLGVVHEHAAEANGAPAEIDWEIPRKLLHSSIGFIVIPLYISHTPVPYITSSLSTALAFIIPADFARFRYPGFARMYERAVGFLMRDSEKTKTNGVIWYIFGVLFVLFFYPLDVAVVSILILSWCDTAASTFGRMYGRYTAPLPQAMHVSGFRVPLPFATRKSFAGFLAACIAGAVITFGFWGWVAPFGQAQPSWPLQSIQNLELSRTNQLFLLSGISLVVGLIAGVAEAVDVGSLDDNLTLPIIAGGAILALFKFIDWVFA